ncbi:MAG: aminoacyl-tRNA hydrolase [Chloroflexota bacterium]|nr:aminoacyl-tRNA hydrolase [Chloroflexota bacterium]
MDTISLGQDIDLPLSELDFSFARSSGPGGQHVNRAETKVELRWDVANSPTLNDAQRATIEERLVSYLTQEGVLLLTSDETRSQHRNREAVIARLQSLVRDALRPRRKRHRTKPSAAAGARRLERKRRHSEKKSHRKKIDPREY